MGNIKTKGYVAWRDFDTDGVPSSGAHNPLKSEIREFVDAVEALVSTGGYSLVTAGVTTDLSQDAFADTKELSINKTVAGAHSVLLDAPDPAQAGRRIQVTDGKGDAGANNITVSGSLNGGADTAVIRTNYGWMTFRDTGTTWNIVG